MSLLPVTVGIIVFFTVCLWAVLRIIFPQVEDLLATIVVHVIVLGALVLFAFALYLAVMGVI